ncbi:3-methyl-2-oxobutanoate hydroxymethyltransferase [Sporomusa malonica]|uniref:3-methyl-2-oxobutanoate hydroxymethyltransferase n=1 Tax=Sporomusa malonica TaxID=112901 RepID=A0A1W2E6X9_9FIRM|nr:3-methyl-2-oxobutanoate hydroxymethyltransferase [Sporomusa malonica]SMD05162.1 ketopantoate hydroxymethyltransferase [Sporomusa malonica]
MSNNRITTATIREKKSKGEVITMLTAYDAAFARLLDDAGVDMLLVGDSVGNVMLGYDSTLPVTMEEMLHHARAVCRGASHCLVVADMPFMSYQVSVEEALRNAGRFLKETGAQAVKLEGGKEVTPAVKAMTSAGIPVVGHLGLTPQSVHQLGGFKVQGKDVAAAQRLLEDARMIEAAGAFALVLECVPAQLASKVSQALSIPTIGIGAGNGCDGQVLVTHDLLGLLPGFKPKFVKAYRTLHTEVSAAVREYIEEVRTRQYPAPEHSLNMADDVLEKLY